MLELPFFDDSHRGLAREVLRWLGTRAQGLRTVDDETRWWVKALGEAGWLRYAVPAPYGGIHEHLDVRSICIIRDTLAFRSGIADFAFAMQGLGTGPISLFGSDAQKRAYLPAVGRGEHIAAFAITERDAGSDVSAMQTTAKRDGGKWAIEGEKTWISNAGIADHYIVFARTPELGERSYGAFIVEASTKGLSVPEQFDVLAPHVLGTLRLDGCRVPEGAVIGDPSGGLKIALATLDVFRTTVAAAALGFARRALEESIAFTTKRQSFGKPLSDHQITQAKLADMAVSIDASELLVYRSAWVKDTIGGRVTREAAIAKLFATESAQRVIDDAVQLHGARGVIAGETVERLYREIRALRIYEGASEIQKLIIAGQVIAAHTQQGAPHA